MNKSFDTKYFKCYCPRCGKIIKIAVGETIRCKCGTFISYTEPGFLTKAVEAKMGNAGLYDDFGKEREK